MLIEDGTGKGSVAKVDNDNRLHTLATTRPIMVTASESGDAYLAYVRHSMVAIGENEPLFQLKNNSEGKEIHVQKMIFSTNSTGVVKAELFVDPTLTSGGTTRSPLNANRSSGKSTIAAVVDNRADDLVMVFDGDKEVLDVRIGEGLHSLVVDLAGALILGPNDTIGVQVEGPAIGAKVRAMIYYYEDVPA